MRQSPRDGAGPAGSGDPPLTDAPTRRGTWGHYLRPFRFEHWIKNLVVPVGSVLALAT